MLSVALAATLIAACGGSNDNTTASNASTSSSTGSSSSQATTATPSNTNDPLLTSWIVNTTNARSENIYESDAASTRALVNVQSVTESTVDGQGYVRVQASGIPDYTVTMTAEKIAALGARSKASSDFVNGATTATVGQGISFGKDIGFRSNGACSAGGGYGYWPPGPVCPKDVDHDGYFTRSPQAGAATYKTGLGSIGFVVNGTSICNYDDGQSYNKQGVWHTLAPKAEVYDVDICGGHAAQGDYHHHFYSPCLAELLGDDGSAHSPIYGFAADGYALYGPWHAAGQLVVSSWVTRDYRAGSATGCGAEGVRTCLLVDVTDPVKGNKTASQAGPTTSGSYTSLSGNVFTTAAGFFLEDYYWDSALAAHGGAYLDRYNGHDHDKLGYHYHITVVNEGAGGLVPYFPFSIGPTFYGALPGANNITSCGG